MTLTLPPSASFLVVYILPKLLTVTGQGSGVDPLFSFVSFPHLALQCAGLK